jgi:hypothetical protein
LDEARACVRDDDCEMNKRELVHALQAQPMNQNYERVLRDLVKQNADLKSDPAMPPQSPSQEARYS